MLAIRLPDTIEERLNTLAAETAVYQDCPGARGYCRINQRS